MHESGVILTVNRMNQDFQHRPADQKSDPQNDHLWDLLSVDAKAYPVTPSPWFAARTAAYARKHAQSSNKALFFRWLMPIPLAALAAVALLSLHGLENAGSSFSYVSSESDFEDHMELMATSIE